MDETNIPKYHIVPYSTIVPKIWLPSINSHIIIQIRYTDTLINTLISVLTDVPSDNIMNEVLRNDDSHERI